MLSNEENLSSIDEFFLVLKELSMTLCPIALAVHCTGCPLVKFCPAKTIIGDFGKTEDHAKDKSIESESDTPSDKSK